MRLKEGGDEPNLNLVQSTHARSPTYFLPCINQGQRWLVDDAMGDEVTLDNKLPAPELNIMTAQFPYANGFKSDLTFLVSKVRTKEK